MTSVFAVLLVLFCLITSFSFLVVLLSFFLSFFLSFCILPTSRFTTTCSAVCSCLQLFTRDSIYSIVRICHANSVCPSVTRVLCVKMAERIIEILSLSDRPVILVFHHQGSLCKSDGFIPNGGTKYKGVAVFNQYAAISQKRFYRGIVTMEVVCALSNGATFDDLE